MNKTQKIINQRACYNRIWSWSPVPCEKHGPRASVTTKTSAFGLGFCLLSPSGHVFSHGTGDHDQILQPFVCLFAFLFPYVFVFSFHINPLRATIFEQKVTRYLHFLSCIYTAMAQIVEILIEEEPFFLHKQYYGCRWARTSIVTLT